MSQKELEQLLNAVVPQAEERLAERGEVYPFGAMMKTDGGVVFSTVEAGDESNPRGQFVELLVSGLRARRADYRAVAICWDGKIRQVDTEEVSDAVIVFLEHADGEAVNIYLPYQKMADGTYDYADLLGTEAQPRVFGD